MPDTHPTPTVEQVRTLRALQVAEQRAQEAAHAALVARQRHERTIGLMPWHAATWEPAQGAVAATALGAAIVALANLGWAHAVEAWASADPTHPGYRMGA